MATFSKKLYMKNTAGTQQSAEIYSTTGEVGSAYAHLVVDGTTGYVPLVSTSNARATSGRVTETSGTTYAIGKAGYVAYSYGLYTSSGTFTVPAKVYKLRVTCVGGGAGVLCYMGRFSITGDDYTYKGPGSYWYYSGAGRKTTFSSVSASGAGSNKVYCVVSSRAVSENYYKNYPTYSNQTVGGGGVSGTSYKSCGYKSGTSGLYVTTIKGNSFGPYGKGGGGGGDGHNDTVYTITGSSGYRTTSTISVTPGQKIAYTVGGGGSGFQDGAAYNVESGSAGAILVEWGLGIE